MIQFIYTVGVDFEDNSELVFRTEPEQTSVTVSIQTFEDEITEVTETFILRIVPGDDRSIVDSEGGMTTVSIIDNDC